MILLISFSDVLLITSLIYCIVIELNFASIVSQIFMALFNVINQDHTIMVITIEIG